MPRTCIICGEPTGSREHIFPAALGGRRTNKGIYCGNHNSAYSGLAAIIAGQLAIFNSQLGVVGDHADAPTVVTMTDVASGQEIDFSSNQVRYKSPQIRSETLEGDRIITEMTFSTQKEVEDWAAKQKEQGFEVQVVGKRRKVQYHLGTIHKQFALGGNEEGLRSIAYIAQTFFAHSFPEVARLPELDGIKDYTLRNEGSGFVWWDFDPPKNLPPNNFPFGHRVIVGVNSEDGTAYARISLFSSLHFAILIGRVSVEVSRAVITDIDPLAKSPPNDIVARSEDAATGTVSKPEDLTAGLAEAVQSGRAEAEIQDLMRRITDFERDAAAASILDRIAGSRLLVDSERDALCASIVSAEAQRVVNLMRYVAKDMKERATSPEERAIAGFMDRATKLDATTENGLSSEATRSLDIASQALAKTMSADFQAGTLDLDRVSMLIGGGAGAYVVGTALLEEFVESLPK